MNERRIVNKRPHASESLRAWLDGREPRPPMDLRGRLLDAVDAYARDSSSTADPRPSTADPGRVAEQVDGVDAPVPDVGTMGALLTAAGSALASAASRPGRVREAAFDLLVADALVTYACEAALESEAPERALASVLAIGEAT